MFSELIIDFFLISKTINKFSMFVNMFIITININE